MNKNSLGTKFSQMLILFYAIMLGHTMFALVIVLILKGEMATLDSSNNMLLYVSAFISTSAVAAGYILYKSRINRIQENDATDKKLDMWRTAFLIKMMLIDVACFLNLTFLMLTNNRIFLYLYILMAIIMLMNKPSQYKTIEELQIGDEQI